MTIDDFNRQISSDLREKLTISDMEQIVTILGGTKPIEHPRNPSPMRSKKLTITQLAERLGVHPLTIRRRIKRGEIKALRLGAQIVRIELEEVERIEANIQNQPTQ
jgi:excisionase family DNA binding protein